MKKEKKDITYNELSNILSNALNKVIEKDEKEMKKRKKRKQNIIWGGVKATPYIKQGKL